MQGISTSTDNREGLASRCEVTTRMPPDAASISGGDRTTFAMKGAQLMGLYDDMQYFSGQGPHR